MPVCFIVLCLLANCAVHTLGAVTIHNPSAGVLPGNLQPSACETGIVPILATTTSTNSITYSIEDVVPEADFSIISGHLRCDTASITAPSYTVTIGANDESGLVTVVITVNFIVASPLTINVPKNIFTIPRDLYEISSDRSAVIDFQFTVSDENATVAVVTIGPETVVFEAKWNSSANSYYLDLVSTLLEKESTFTIRIQATIGDPQTAETMADINVTLIHRPIFTAPYDMDPYQKDIPETVPGLYTVLTLSATDQDNDPLTYTLKSILPPTNEPFFTLTDADLKIIADIGDSLDVDTQGALNYELKISVSDGNLTSETTIVINVTDVNDNAPMFSPSQPLQVSILDTTTEGEQIENVTAVDGDFSSPNNEITYTLTGEDNDHFTINQDGSIKIATPSQLNYSAKAIYNLTITATDASPDIQMSSDITLDITLETGPTFKTTNAQTPLPETTEGNSAVYTFEVEDPDNPGLSLTYSVDNVQPASGMLLFQMDGDILKTNGTVTSSTFDLEPSNDQPTDSYVLQISVTDGKYSATTSLIVNVTDVNDKTPTFQNSPYNFTVFEGASAGEEVVKATATDEDFSSPNNEFEFSLSGDGSTHFLINDQGSITVANPSQLDYSLQAVYNLMVTVTDKATESSKRLSSTAQITGTVETAPEFKSPASPNTQTSMAENTGGSSVVYTCEVEDQDNPTLTLTYSVKSVQPNTGSSFFQMDGPILKTSGSVTASTFDLEPANVQPMESYIVSIRVTDGSYSAETSLVVNITDVNDKTPMFTNSAYSADVLETQTGDEILTVTATDDDISSPNNNVIFSLSGADSGHFTINDAGRITVTTPSQLDYTNRPVYNLVITATDRATTNTLSSTADLTVNIEVAPRFIKPSDGNTVIDLGENTGPNKSQFTCEVVDEDSQDPNTLSYSVKSVQPSSGTSFFRMDGVTLKTSPTVTTTTFDIDSPGSQQTYVITIMVEDGKYSAEAVVTVSVTDVNDNTPDFGGPITQNINDILALGQEVVKVSATDNDVTSVHNTVSYSLTASGGSTDYTIFEINSTTGSVTLNGELKKASYSFTVIARNADFKEGRTTVTVNVRDTINECESSPCENEGTCYQNVNYFFCDCTNGWSGRTCNINIDDCDPNPCENNGMCTDGVNSYTCNCSSGWTATNCTEACSNNKYGRNCADTCQCNETRLASGTESQTCNITTGACFCDASWRGDLCETDVDECIENTTLCTDQANYVCVNTIGSYQCVCKQGYRAVSQTCVEEAENKTVTTTAGETVIRATFVQGTPTCENLDQPSVYAARKAEVEQKERVRITTANDVRAFNLRCGSLIYELAIIINDTMESRARLALDLNDIRNGKPLVLNNQTSVTTGLNVTGSTINFNGTTDVSLQICEIFTSYVPCGQSYECKVTNGTPFCREKEKDNIDLVLGLALGLPLGILAIACVVFVVCCYKRKRHRHGNHNNRSRKSTDRDSVKNRQSMPPSYDNLDFKWSSLPYNHSLRYNYRSSVPSVTGQKMAESVPQNQGWVFYSPSTRHSSHRPSQRF